MRRLILFALLPLSGCGLVDGFDQSLVGDYTGTYQIREGSSQESAGQLSLIISSGGAVTGVMQRTDRPQPPASVESGEIRNYNELRFRFRYEDTSYRSVSGTIRTNGSLLEAADGVLSVEFSGGGSGTMMISLVRT
jgi:hypothetical protein